MIHHGVMIIHGVLAELENTGEVASSIVVSFLMYLSNFGNISVNSAKNSNFATGAEPHRTDIARTLPVFPGLQRKCRLF